MTNGTPTMPGILNPVTAACDGRYVPDEVWVLSNPGVADYVAEAIERFEVIIDAYDGDADVSTHNLADERTFAASSNSTDLLSKQLGRMTTRLLSMSLLVGNSHPLSRPSRGSNSMLTMSIISIRNQGATTGSSTPEIPRTATDLIDFKEVL